MAQAGWYFAPTLEAPDMTICYLCNLGLGGWEEEDSPMYVVLSSAPGAGTPARQRQELVRASSRNRGH